MTTLPSTPGSTASLGERKPCQPLGLSESEEPWGMGWGGWGAGLWCSEQPGRWTEG